MGALFLDQVANDLLSAAEDALSQTGLGLPDLPERRFVSHGQPAWDCDLLAVSLERIRSSSTTVNNNCALRSTGDFAIWLVRCVPQLGDEGNVPSEADLDASGGSLLRDAWVLWTDLLREWYAGTLVSSNATCTGIEWGNLTPLEPSGGYAGWKLPVSVELNDITPPVGS